ncbi:transposase InsO family protein [Bosea robiniae]|uniref:Mu transposase C-terminal domain-containing protein n=1 Tax=Bosea TaxID=85413 RepID=UPI00286536B1|nr:MULTISPECIES: Mu transposase C-terminal domain-containing protein [Bosea]MDR6831587.1 transposase InsO family protein [Bosea robiniae]MDR6898296.1 transposase InsO family protein [Bosea sp. BE109]MDR7141693.1 transposase InsO family protein [Bosea sp. BE168]
MNAAAHFGASIKLMVNQKLRINGVHHRVRRRIDDTRFNIEAIETGEASTHTFAWLDEGWLEGRIAILPTNWDRLEPRVQRLVSSDMDNATKAMRAFALKMHPYVQALLDHGDGLIKPYQPVEALWKAIADKRNANPNVAPADYETPPSRSSIYMFAKRYRDADRDIRALLPDYQSRGNRKARISPILDDVIDELIEAIYLTPEARTKSALLAACITHVQNLNDAIGTSYAEISEPLPMPTRKMISYRAGKLERFDLDYYRKDPIKAEMAHMPVGIGPVATRINQRWELDSTTLDLHVVDGTTNAMLGRPTLTAVIDCASRLIVGWAITFEGESTLQIMLALRHAIAPKRFPNLDLRLGNPARGIPEGIWMDNGKAHHSSSLKEALLALNITPFWLPPKRPMLRGKIERWFGSMNIGLVHQFAGTTKSNPQQKGDYDAESEAIFTLEDVENLLSFWICDVYNARVHRGTKNSPYALWVSMSKAHPPILPSQFSDLDVLLSSSDTRTISRKGIEWKGLLYNSDELALLRNSQQLKADQIKIRYDAADIGSLMVLAPGWDRYKRIPCTNQPYAAGKTLYQHEASVAHAKKLVAAGKPITEQDLADAWGTLVTAGTRLMETQGRRRTLNRLGRIFARGVRRRTDAPTDVRDWEVDGIFDCGPLPAPDSLHEDAPSTRGSYPHYDDEPATIVEVAKGVGSRARPQRNSRSGKPKNRDAVPRANQATQTKSNEPVEIKLTAPERHRKSFEVAYD